MKTSAIVAAALLLIATTAAVGASATNVWVDLGLVKVYGARTNLSFECGVTINNQATQAIYVESLFERPPGLALYVSSADGTELGHAYAFPLISYKWTFDPNTSKRFKLTYPAEYGSQRGALHHALSNLSIVKLQIRGTMSGSSYTGAITSNVVEVKLP